MVSDLLTTADRKFPSVLLSLDMNAAIDPLDYHSLLQRAKELLDFDDLPYYSTQLKQKHSLLVPDNKSRNLINHVTFQCSV